MSLKQLSVASTSKQISLQQDSSQSTLYTVPPGRRFEGQAVGYDNNGIVKVNGVGMIRGIDHQTLPPLLAGTVVVAAYAGIVGVESDA